MEITADKMISKYNATADEYKEDIRDTFYRMTVMGFISWEIYITFINTII